MVGYKWVCHDKLGPTWTCANKTDKGAQIMSESYKVGEISEYGTLLAESYVIGRNVQSVRIGQINSLYANPNKGVFTIIEWANLGQSDECAESTTNYTTLEEARQMWILFTYGVKA